MIAQLIQPKVNYRLLKDCKEGEVVRTSSMNDCGILVPPEGFFILKEKTSNGFKAQQLKVQDSDTVGEFFITFILQTMTISYERTVSDPQEYFDSEINRLEEERTRVLQMNDKFYQELNKHKPKDE
jgi:hypothetical protein